MSLDMDATVAVVGGSLAGLRAAETLRHEGHRGPVIVVSAETHAPYDRPPLSKQLLAGTWDEARIALRPPEKLQPLGLEFRVGRTATALDPEEGTVSLDDGSTVRFDAAVVATGARVRRLPFAEGVGGVHYLRTLDDCRALRAAVAAPGARLVVIGAGFIGAEVAATCKGLGVDVTVLETLPVPLARILGEEMGAACAALHARHEVTLRTGTAVSGLRTEPDAGGGVRVTAVELADGTAVPADVVVVGIGVEPVTDWLDGSGLEIENGVVAEATLFVADDVVAAGDITRWFDEGLGRYVRVEHWTNAAEQGMHAARSLLAGRLDATVYAPVPYFWSDQYDTKIQMLGHPAPDDDVVVVDGSVEDGKFVAVYGRQGRLTAALAFSRPRQLMAFRQLLVDRASFGDALAALG